MPALGSSDLEVSRLGLGTVEIGVSSYGVGSSGLISEGDAIALLKAAVERGVTYIDTARGYGVAEERIGKSGIAKQEGVVIGTKCAQFLRDERTLSGEVLESKIREEVDTSRRLLGLGTLDLVQIHLELPDYTDLRELVEIMQKLVSEEKVKYIGIATRGEDVPLAAIETGFFTSIQSAYSIVDQRMTARVLPAAETAGVGIINRSALLKGSLTPARQHLPEQLAPLKATADAAEAIAAELGTDLPSLALRFCHSHEAVDTILLGTTKPQRLDQALAAIEEGPLSNDILSQLESLGLTDPDQIDPSRWPK